MKTCAKDGCERVSRTKRSTLCSGHYLEFRDNQVKRPADLGKIVAQFHSKYVVEPATGCWNWTTSNGGKFYPNLYIGQGTDLNAIFGPGPTTGAHRFSWWLHHGSIESYSVIHHKCVVKTCVNPAHLQEVSNLHNLAEMMERRAYEKRIVELEAKLAACTCNRGSA